MTKKKVLWISNYGYENSYASVTKTLLNAWLKTYPDMYEMYLYCIGQTQYSNFAQLVAQEIPIPVDHIYFIMIYGKSFDTPEDREFVKNHILGIHGFKYLKTVINPDLIISLNDISPYLIQKNAADKLGMTIIPYIPYDMDRLTTQSMFSKHQYPAIITPSAHSAAEYSKIVNCPIHVLPHIVNDSAYYELGAQDKMLLRQKWINNSRPDDFVIVAVNRNNVRKRLDLLVKAFNVFAYDKPNAKLLLKTDLIDTVDRFESIVAPQYTFDLSDPKITLITDCLSVYEINEIYNCAHVGLSTTSGEGFGLTPCEMSLCRVAQIVPNNTSHPWIFGSDYKGLINCTEYSAGVARSFSQISEIENDFICILKIYEHFDNNTVYVDNLSISDTILTLILSPTKQAGKNTFDNIPDLLEYLDSVLPNILRVQILLNTNLEFMTRLDFDTLLTRKWDSKKCYAINQTQLNSYIKAYSATGLPDIVHTVELLNKCYYSEEFREMLAEQCYTQITSRFTEECIVESMRSILGALADRARASQGDCVQSFDRSPYQNLNTKLIP